MVGVEIFKLVKKLFPINRSIAGEGLRSTLYFLKNNYVPNMKMLEIPSGTKVGDWSVPDEWKLDHAYIQTLSGETIVDAKNSNLHVVNYSIPVDGIFSKEELDKHLHSLEDMRDAVPYVTGYYAPVWGFCISHEQRETMLDEHYKAVIKSELKPGALTIGELYIPGTSQQEIFISTYVCHPSMANNELSGPCVASFLAEYLSKRQNRYSIRIVWAPETIGAIAYLSERKHDLKNNVFAAFNLTCVGDDNNWSFLPSRKGNTIADKVARFVLRERGIGYEEYSFLKDRGSDERQYCAPSIDLPMVSIMRSKYGKYREYHTSLDNLDFISPSGLEGSYEVHVRCIQILEENKIYVATLAGEPFLSKRGYNYRLVGGQTNNRSVKAQEVLDVFMCCDGQNDLIDICTLTGLSFALVHDITDFLAKDDLIVLLGEVCDE